MKVLSLIQPYATLIAIGAKRIETRSWMVQYRGRLAIHASKGFPAEYREYCREWPFDEALATADFSTWGELPCGVIVATCELIGCIKTDVLREGRGRGEVFTRYPFSDWERAFGDYSPGRWAWLLADVKPLAEPIPAAGSRGLWNYPLEVQP